MFVFCSWQCLVVVWRPVHVCVSVNTVPVVTVTDKARGRHIDIYEKSPRILLLTCATSLSSRLVVTNPRPVSEGKKKQHMTWKTVTVHPKTVRPLADHHHHQFRVGDNCRTAIARKERKISSNSRLKSGPSRKNTFSFSFHFYFFFFVSSSIHRMLYEGGGG